MNDIKYILLTTPEEHAQITYYVQMQLAADTLFDAIGEIINIPGCELVSPLYYKVDPRAPQLRFVEQSDLEPPNQQKIVPQPPPPQIPQRAQPSSNLPQTGQQLSSEPLPKMYLVQEIKLEDINPNQ